MEQERNETYERVPWEMLEQKGKDRQWLMLAVSGAVVVGALVYSFVSSRPPAPEPVAVSQEVAPAAPPVTVSAPTTPASTAAPLVTAEADLYAVSPERLVDQAAAHAEWFIAEYFTVDGSEEQQQTLAALMPVGVPLPPTAEGTTVFVEWVRAAEVEEIAPLQYRVDVLVRYLVAADGQAYQRQRPLVATVEVMIGEDGARVHLPPEIGEPSLASGTGAVLADVPAEIGDAALAKAAGTEVIGGVQSSEGRWRVVVMASGADGLTRPITVTVP